LKAPIKRVHDSFCHSDQSGVYLSSTSLIKFNRKGLGKAGLLAVRKFFGVILLAIAVKIFASNASGLIK
jgi:multiple antibiotic resistance protein